MSASGAAGSGRSLLLSPIELRPSRSRSGCSSRSRLAEQGHHRNLLVAATGTGKTVMAAVDYARLRTTLPRARLLFVAHREEILDQSLATFRHALRDPPSASAGSAAVGRAASITSSRRSRASAPRARDLDPRSLRRRHRRRVPPRRRALVPALLDHLAPVELLGSPPPPSAATACRCSDWFDGRIAAELRLWDAIDQHRLAPFAYYGIHDGLDLREIPWRRGRGLRRDGLSNLVTANDAWARSGDRSSCSPGSTTLDDARPRLLRQRRARPLHGPRLQRGGHRRDGGVGRQPDAERRDGPARLAARGVNVVFSVDLFNEGIDVPAVDTLLLLRPTDSPTLFLQQLGRGLRKQPRARGSAPCSTSSAITAPSSASTGASGPARRDSPQGPDPAGRARLPVPARGLPHGARPRGERTSCWQPPQALPSRRPAKVEELRRLAQGGARVTMRGFLEETGSSSRTSTGDDGWSDLCEAAGLAVRTAGPHEKDLRSACARLLHVDDPERIDAFRSFVEHVAPPVLAAMDERSRRLVRMLVAAGDGASARQNDHASPRPARCCGSTRRCSRSCASSSASSRVASITCTTASSHIPTSRCRCTPLHAHRDPRRVRHRRGGEGPCVADGGLPGQGGARGPPGLHARQVQRQLLTDHALPRLRDQPRAHPLGESVDDRAASDTGRRYQTHVAGSTSIMLFARLRSDDRAFWFLGPASYLRHESEMPMAVTWRLHHPLPGDLFASFAAAVA
jgi:superfamily II DNA or RNA helicase